MAFVVYKLELGARQVEMVYATQAEANSAAAGNPAWTAQTGPVNDNVNPGDFIRSDGHLLSAPPADFRDNRLAIERTIELREAFNGWVLRRPTWLEDVGDANHNDALTASTKWAYMSCALADAIILRVYLQSQSRTNRDSFVEHIIKALNDDDRDAYGRFLASKPIRDSWSGANVADGQPVYSDMVTGTLGTPKDPDGSFTRVASLIIPNKFDPSREGLRDT